ncbi:4-(cytidine 5'-diphospho)-2-C-methyl-D-erythritol kinase [Phyllobacterium sp. CCNWLW109]|uniref:4-(cytidine 5'-diphospho)-2-C-methyl-D-erythritol kinase n=1 Tax=Phyllobacterium sp. CCNWLW109 TaxID=3127479 RepID=UPI003077505B
MLDSLDQAISMIAPAKINLALHITGQRNDGYHLLDTLVVFAGYGDRISIARSSADSFRITGPYGHSLPADASNLVLKARDRLRAEFPDQAFPVSIELEKHLPIASGVGGGSSDAASTLKALVSLWNINIDPVDLNNIGLAMGADLPMCLHGRPLIARGIGEELEAVTAIPRLPMVLVNNGAAVSTPQVFGALKKRNNPGLPNLPRFGSVNDVCAYLEQTDNHLYAATVELLPIIGDTMDALYSTSPRLARMSGSGATCFAIYDTDEAASAAASLISNAYPLWFVVKTDSGEGEN